MNKKILIVDDEKEIVDLLEVYLSNDGYSVYKCYNGLEAMKCIKQSQIDLAILDIMLPDIDGFRLCQKIREKFYFPIIMLTAKIEDSDKIMGLTIGADDYITKPFNPLEVVARVKTQLRRYQSYNSPNLSQSEEKDEYDIRGLLINRVQLRLAAGALYERVRRQQGLCAQLLPGPGPGAEGAGYPGAVCMPRVGENGVHGPGRS